jgi:hypothetical protein
MAKINTPFTEAQLLRMQELASCRTSNIERLQWSADMARPNCGELYAEICDLDGVTEQLWFLIPEEWSTGGVMFELERGNY